MLAKAEVASSAITANRLSPKLFLAVRDYAYRTAGIELQDGKQEMVAARLWKRARALGFHSAEDYFDAVQRDTGGDLQVDILDALTTNYTSFFREPAHFDFLRDKIIPVLRRRSQFTIWTAASSSGEEPYSIAVTLVEALGDAAFRQARVRASDISTKVLRSAEAGIYAEEKFRNLSTDWRSRYLLRGKGEQAGNFRFRAEIRKMMQFERINLMEPLPAEGPFPLIFLRNIMIYFDRPTQEKVVAAMSAKLEPGGYLFIGHSESLNGIQHSLEHVQVAIYKKAGRLEERAA
jgi:chemotaxis protein methyltransferase CheR